MLPAGLGIAPDDDDLGALDHLPGPEAIGAGPLRLQADELGETFACRALGRSHDDPHRRRREIVTDPGTVGSRKIRWIGISSDRGTIKDPIAVSGHGVSGKAL